MWKNEVKILKTLNHPSVIKILGSNISSLQLEQEYGGQDLSKFVDIQRMSTLSRDTAHQIWIDIGSGLEHIHSKKILHLDIKPENILVGQGNRVKICDFGISMQPALQPVRYGGGTPAYLPPECRRGIRGRPGDVWACGLVMMFVLGICPLPSPGKWKVANVHMGMDDSVKMEKWLDEIERYKKELPDDSASKNALHRTKETNHIFGTGQELARTIASCCSELRLCVDEVF